jgi:outer membrane protein assembly factor BamD (BamD/ComL family)
MGEYKKALEVYERIESQYPKSEESRDIEKYITSVKIKMKS